MGALQRNEWIAYDYLLAQKRHQQPAPDDIVILLVDDASLQFMDPLVGRWPWPRSVFADVVDYLSLGNPKAIVFDMLFVERQLKSPGEATDNDKRLTDASQNAGNVVHAMQFIHENQDDANNQVLNKPLPADIVKGSALPDTSATSDSIKSDNKPVYNQYLIPIEGLYQSAMALGAVSVEPDQDGVLRRTPLVFRYQNDKYAALSLAALLRQNVLTVSLPGNQLSVDGIPIPLDERGNYLVNFYPSFNTFSLSGVLSSIAALNQGDIEHLIIRPDEFQDKYVFIGSSAVGLHDLKTTPLGGKQPGVLLHASVLGNVLQNDFLTPASSGTTWLILLLASLVTALGVLYLKLNILKLAWPLPVVAMLGFWCYWQSGNNQVVAVIRPLLAIALSWALAYAYLLFTEGREKNNVRKMFSRYVSPAALAAMIDNYDAYKDAGIGTKEIVTILFCDIRGFTTLSESLPAEKVVELLNFYFSQMTEAILAHNGTIDKFIGDAIMATWGAPVKSHSHANDATRAALTMVEKLTIVNQWLAEHQLQPIDIGIGIHTGEVVLGSIGSEQKADYTVIGDNVNLASRLEGVTKTYGCRLVLSEATHQQLREIPCVLIDMIRVKGKTQPIKIYTPLQILKQNPSEDTPPDNVQRSPKAVQQCIEQALNAYLDQYWEDAIAQFNALPNRRLAELYISRCEQFKRTPPPEDWDGVYVMTSK